MKNNKWLFLIAITLILVGVAIYFYLNSRSSETHQSGAYPPVKVALEYSGRTKYSTSAFQYW